MRKTLIFALFFSFATFLNAQNDKLDKIYAPAVVGVPPTDAYIGFCKMPDGELRHYNYGENETDNKHYYLSSFDNGFTWDKVYISDAKKYADIQSPKSGKFIRLFSDKSGVYAIRTDNVEGGESEIVKVEDGYSLMIKPPVFIRNGERIIVSAHRLDKKGSLTYVSDDDGKTWQYSNEVTVPLHEKGGFHKGTRWNHGGVEPTVTELSDGTLWMIIRTSLDNHYQAFSHDGGLTWSESTPSPFYGTITMPTFQKLKDGRLLFFWTNTTPLPEMETANGVWDDVFTNRNVTHVAISEDDGKTWTGARELFLDERRNASDFGSVQGMDKSVHQAQCIELEDNKVIVSIGQDYRHRKMLIFDLDWLYEKNRSNEFENGLADWSTFKYYKGIQGHCGYNRIEGGRLLPHSDKAGKSMLNIKYQPDDTLVCDNDGALWNFPAAKKGEFKTSIKIPENSQNVTLILNDRWFNPSDTVAKYYSIYNLELNREDLGITDDAWHEITIRWKHNSQATYYVDNKKRGVLPLKHSTIHGISYVHFISGNIPDETGIFIEKVSASKK